MARQAIPPSEATNEGSRLLRELLRRSTFGQIARRLRCDESAVRNYARERRRPDLIMRARIESEFAIPDRAWDEPPSSADVYADNPATTRRT